MAAQLPRGQWGGPNTEALASDTYTKAIPRSALKKGDLLIDAIGDNHTRHVVIFEKWEKVNETY